MKFSSILTLGGLFAIFTATQAEAQSTYPNPYTFTTFAGIPVSNSNADGIGSAARFSYPEGVAVDSNGNLYVADTENSTIRKITNAGVVTTMAGSAGSTGSADGTGSAARFSFPTGIAVDSSGNLYVADTNNYTIRKITSTGVVTTLAGSAGSRGSADGTGSSARFYYPSGVAVDVNGNIYVADTNNSTIRMVTPSGVVTTLAGSAGNTGNADGMGSAARFNYPQGVAVDGNDNVFVADTYNQTIRKITSTGMVTTLAGSAGSAGSANGRGSGAQFYYPFGVAVDGKDNVYVADTENNTIRMITSAGVVTTLAGSAGSTGSSDGIGSNAQFNYPQGVAVGANDNVYVADADNSTIRMITSVGMVTTLAGNASSPGSTDGIGSAARFSYPEGVAVDGSGNVYVADSDNSTIRMITSAGVVTTLAGSAGNTGSADGTGSAAQFNHPFGVAVDSSGNVYVADAENSTIRKITNTGVVTTLAGSAGNTGSADGTGNAARFSHATGLAVDGNGNVYVADTYNHTIRKITSAGAVTTLAGSAGNPGNANGMGSTARFYYPFSVAVDGSGNVYVADTDNDTIRKITSAGMVTTLAGLANSPGSTDGTGNAARFSSPESVGVDGNGNVYVADTDNYTIRMVTNAGVVTTLAGLANNSGIANGTGNAALFNFPQGVAVDGYGNVYVADSLNCMIRLGTPNSRSAQTITFSPVGNLTFGTGPITLAATDNSGGPIVYSVLYGPATISGNLLTITGTGSVTISATQSGSTIYAAATSTQTFSVVLASTDTPTMPQWGLLVLTGLLIFFAIRRKPIQSQ